MCYRLSLKGAKFNFAFKWCRWHASLSMLLLPPSVSHDTHLHRHAHTHAQTHTQSSVWGIYLYLSMYIADYAHKWFIYLFTYCQCQWREFFHDAAATCSRPASATSAPIPPPSPQSNLLPKHTHTLTHNTSACPHEFQFELQLRSNLLDICRWTHSQ